MKDLELEYNNAKDTNKYPSRPGKANAENEIIKNSSDNFKEIEFSTIETQEHFPIEGLYVGEIFTASPNWRSRKVYLSENDYIKYSLYSSANANLITFFNNADSVISYLTESAGDLAINQEGLIEAPANTSYAVVTTHKSKLSLSSYSLNLFDMKSLSNKFYARYINDTKTIIVDSAAVEDPDNFIFNTLTDAVAIAGSSYKIKIFGDEASPYIENNIDLPDSITIVGIGTPVIQGELPSNSSVEDIEDISTLNAYGSFKIFNLKVTAKNMRYAVHADYSNGNEYIMSKNSSFIHLGNQEAYAYHLANVGDESSIFRACSAWGGGTESGDEIYIDNCYFESTLRAFSYHNNVNFDTTDGASTVKVENSKFRSHGIDTDGSNLLFVDPIHVHSIASNTNDTMVFNNCYSNGYIVMNGTPSHEVMLGIKNQKQVWNIAGGSGVISHDWNNLDVNWYIKIPEEVESLKNMNVSTLVRGKAIKKSGIGFDLFTSSDSVADFYGILMEDVETGKSGDIKQSGYLPYKYFTGSAYSINADLDISVDATGDFVQNSTHVVCVSVDNYNILIS